MTVRAFYDGLAPLYHLIYADWDSSIARQGEALASLLSEHWPADRSVLDVSVGIGTQALGLAAHGYAVVGSDLSPVAVARAREEATRRGVPITCLAADFRSLPFRAASVSTLIACDNSLPHLESEAEISAVLAEWVRVVRPGGGCLISMRDYGTPPPAGTVTVEPYGERLWQGRRYKVRQVWTWFGQRYELSMEIAPIDGIGAQTVVKTSYLAIAVARVEALMRAAGFLGVRRIDGRFFQPVIVGTVQ